MGQRNRLFCEHGAQMKLEMEFLKLVAVSLMCGVNDFPNMG